MICPRCGNELSAATERCPRCAAPLATAVAAGVLTPPPSDDGQTRFPSAEDGETRFVDARAPTARGDQAVPPEVFEPPSDGGQTRVVDPRAPTSLHESQSGDALTAFVGASTIGHAARASRSAVSGPQGPLQPGQAFGTRYQIIRTLGVGGMGAVYEAFDAELGVTVALKVIRPEVMADPTAAAEIERRFKRELLLARQVTHKNVVRIHDLGDIDGLKFITMSYVDGADLATILKRDGNLPVARVVRVARSVVSGLVEAHKQGVVHRDLKPANIMITAEDDDAMIMDFGIARSTGGSTARTGQTAVGAVPGPSTIVRNLGRGPLSPSSETVFGAVLGTVEYMAPEQAQGRPVDQRADVYAFGLILYDLLTGEPRSAKALSPILELQGRMQKAPPPIQTFVPEVPEPFAEIIARCLEPDPDKRFQTSEEVSAALALLDDNGVPIPIPPRFGKKIIAAAGVVVISLVTGTWWFTRTPPVEKPPDPVSVLIADFENTTNDQSLDHTVEPMLRLALEGAGFISAHDRTRMRASFGVQPPEKLDEAAARQIALKQALGIVLSGSIGRKGNGYEVSIKASQPITGNVVTSVNGTASGKDDVLQVVTRLATSVRKVLGDKTSESDQLFAMRSITASSLDVVSLYTTGMQLQSRGKYEEARENYLKAVKLEPTFGLGYQNLAIMSGNVGKLQDAETFAKEALKYVDKMTERERFLVRGNYYKVTGDLKQCVEEYGQLIKRYSADTAAHNQRAICLVKLRNMAEALKEMREAVAILPNHMTYRGNLALFADYAGDFATAEKEVRSIKEPSARALQALPLSLLGQGRLQEATEAYQKLATMGAWGASFGAAGLGDLALYQGRFADAVKIFDQGAAADLEAKNADAAALKFAALAYVQLQRGQSRAAVAAADKALLNSKALPVQFLAGRILVEAGSLPKAEALAASLASQLAAEPQAYGKIMQGEIALKKRDRAEAVKLLNEANAVVDTWLGHFDLGRTYLEAGSFAQADSEFERCIKRRGEALVLLDEDPTYGYLPSVYYYQGRARQGIGTAGFADSYNEYLKIRGNSTDDPLLPEVRKRAGG
jgi:serine/threonine protein kinase/tetratricopeptide (TPR) repeat protein